MSDRLFTGREKERRFFISMLEGREPTRVLAITGMGGIGKTELLKQFQLLADERHIPWARIDGSATEDVPRILDEVARQLAAKGVKLEPLTRSLREYARIRAKLPPPARAAFTMAAEAIGGASQAIPGLPPELAAGAQVVSGELAGSIYDVLKPADVELYLDAPRRLTDKFLESLRKTRRGTILLFDSYEKMLNLDSWLRELAPSATELGVWLVIAGQAKLDTHWTEIATVRELHLSSLTLREAKSFLRREGLTDPVLIDSIARFSYGVPLALHLAADLALKYDIRDFDRAPQKQQIVDQLLQRTAVAAGPEKTGILLACSIPRALTVPIIQRLLPGQDASTIVADVRSRPYIVFRPAGVALHDSIREFAYAKLKYQDPTRFEELHRAMVAYYDDQLGKPSEERRELDADWLDQARERLYHTLHSDEDEGFRYFDMLYWQIDARFQFVECLNLANAFLRFPFTNEHLASEGRLYKAHALYDLRRWKEAEEICLQVLKSETDRRIRGYVLNDLGRISAALSQWEKARDYFEASAALKRGLGDEYHLGLSLLRLGDVHGYLHTDQGHKEIQIFREALAIFDRLGLKYRQADANYHLSFSHCRKGNWEDAEQYASAALTLGEAEKQGPYRATYQRACTLLVLTHVYRHRGFFGKAEEHAREALALFRRLDHEYRVSDALQSLAHVALLRGNMNESRACLGEALAIARRMNDEFLVSIIDKTLGQIHLSQGRLDEAQEAFRKYLQTMEEVQEELRVALARHHLGEVCYRQGKWATAKENLRHATRYFYCQSSATFRGVESLRLLGSVLVEENHVHGGLQLLRFALSEAEEHNLLHVQAKTHLSLAQTLLNESAVDRQVIERHLDAAAKLAKEQEYMEIADQVAHARLRWSSQGKME